MHTVSLFPHFLDYQILGIFLLRVTLGFIFIRFCYQKVTVLSIKNFKSIIPIILGIAGVLLVVGLYTQGAAIIAGVLVSFATLNKFRRASSHPDNTIEFYILLAVVSFSFLFFGAGAFAIDLAV